MKKTDKSEIARVFDDIADMLEIQDEDIFRIRAFRRAANSIRSMTEDINRVSAEGRLTRLPAIGKGMAERIDEMLRTGRLAYYEQLKEKIPPRLLDLMRVPGVGPKKAKSFYDELHITGVEEMKKAAEAHKIAGLKGLSVKTEENILKGIELYQSNRDRLNLSEAYPIADRFVSAIKSLEEVVDACPAGSLRRMRETIGDIDILASSDRPDKVIEEFTQLPEVSRVLAKGETKGSIIDSSGLQVDLRVVPVEQYGSALQYFTGSKDHNVHLRDLAKRQGYKISEYGIFKVKTGKRIGGEVEDDIYLALGMDTMLPTLREDRGEIEASLKHSLPKVVVTDDIRGDLQVHSTWSDGLNKIADLRQEAKKLGYEYLAITDHALKLRIAGGMSLDEIKARNVEIKKLNDKGGDPTVLSGVELNIDGEGEVDYDLDTLKLFDVVVGSVHSGFQQPEEVLTKRMVKAMNNPMIHIIAHPTGRVIGKRPPYALDMEKVFDEADKTGTILEINAYPDRLDLKDEHIREAKRRGLKLAISTDSHQAAHLRYMMFGVAEAQRGWLEPADVINTRPLKDMLRMLK